MGHDHISSISNAKGGNRTLRIRICAQFLDSPTNAANQNLRSISRFPNCSISRFPNCSVFDSSQVNSIHPTQRFPILRIFQRFVNFSRCTACGFAASCSGDLPTLAFRGPRCDHCVCAGVETWNKIWAGDLGDGSVPPCIRLQQAVPYTLRHKIVRRGTAETEVSSSAH